VKKPNNSLNKKALAIARAFLFKLIVQPTQMIDVLVLLICIQVC
jgi:hypothetical protein